MTDDVLFYLRKSVSIGQKIRETMRKDAAREVECKICRDHYVIIVKYLDDKGHDKQGEFRCDCAGANDSKYFQYKSVWLLFAEIDFVICDCCGKVFRPEKNKLDTRLARKPGTVAPLCKGCFRNHVTEFETELKTQEAELARLEEENKKRPKISREQLMEQLKKRNRGKT